MYVVLMECYLSISFCDCEERFVITYVDLLQTSAPSMQRRASGYCGPLFV